MSLRSVYSANAASIVETGVSDAAMLGVSNLCKTRSWFAVSPGMMPLTSDQCGPCKTHSSRLRESSSCPFHRRGRSLRGASR